MSVRITDQRLMDNNGKRLIEAWGLSTDPKPTRDVITGSVFIEIDTSDVYFFNEDSSTWIKAGGT